VKTSDVSGAGTDANVFVTLFGMNGDTGELHLKKSETYKDPFENNQLDVFTIKDLLSVGELSKCRVWHDNKGILLLLIFSINVHLKSILIFKMITQHVKKCESLHSVNFHIFLHVEYLLHHDLKTFTVDKCLVLVTLKDN